MYPRLWCVVQLALACTAQFIGSDLKPIDISYWSRIHYTECSTTVYTGFQPSLYFIGMPLMGVTSNSWELDFSGLSSLWFGLPIIHKYKYNICSVGMVSCVKNIMKPGWNARATTCSYRTDKTVNSVKKAKTDKKMSTQGRIWAARLLCNFSCLQ